MVEELKNSHEVPYLSWISLVPPKQQVGNGCMMFVVVVCAPVPMEE